MTSPARERRYAAWVKTVAVDDPRAVFDAGFDSVKQSLLAVLWRRGGAGATFGALIAFTGCQDTPTLLAALQELLDCGEAEERAGHPTMKYTRSTAQ